MWSNFSTFEVSTLETWIPQSVGTHLELQSWYKDYFKLKTFEIQHMEREAFSEFSHLTKNRNFLETRTALNSLFRVASTLRRETKSKPTINPPLRRVLWPWRKQKGPEEDKKEKQKKTVVFSYYIIILEYIIYTI